MKRPIYSIIGILLTGAMVVGVPVEARSPSRAVVRAQAQLSKQRMTLQRARLKAWPRLSGAPRGMLGPTPQRGIALNSTDTGGYRSIPKKVRRQLEPRVQSILKHLSRTGQRGTATFDGDGTLWGGDVGEGFFQWMLKGGHYPQERLPMLWRAWHGYKAGTFDGEKMYELMVTGLAGMKETEVKSLAERYFDTTHRHRIYKPSANLITALKTMGIEPWVVSGSPYWVVAAGARHMGIPASRVIGLSVKLDHDGRLTGEVVRPVPWKQGKAKRIMQQVGQVPVLAAGNSYGDIQMLKTATELSLVINPEPTVLRQAQSLNWIVHRYSRDDEMARSIRMLPAPRPPAGLLPPPGAHSSSIR